MIDINQMLNITAYKMIRLSQHHRERKDATLKNSK
ncbi:MAG: hypothetical protein ACI8UC_000891 [Psychromonas sp.]|jgi:hypothetical protein